MTKPSSRDRLLDYRDSREAAEELRREYAALIRAKELQQVCGVYVQPRKLGGRLTFAVMLGGYSEAGLTPPTAA